MKTSFLFRFWKTIRDFITAYEIWIFLFLAPTLNTFMTYLSDKGIITGFVYTHGRFYALMFLLICIVKIAKGNEGIKDMFRPMLRWKAQPKWYVFSLLFALTISSLSLLVKSYYYGIDYRSILKFDMPTLKNSFVLLSWAFMGEVVWVSYAIRELSKILKPFIASQIVGFFWALWWVPSVLINEGVILDLPLWPLFFNMMGGAGVCLIVYQKTKSGICLWLLQYMFNMAVLILPVSPTVGGVFVYKTEAILYFLAMLGLMYLIKPIEKIKIAEKKI